MLEARFVANKIKELIENKYQVTDKLNQKHNIKYKDIAVLLRNANSVAPIYEKEISECGITVYSDSSESYLQSIEIDTIMSLLKIIDNPMQDIPFVTVLRSMIGNFTDNELIEISYENDKKSFYEKMENYLENAKDEILKNKIINFLNKVDKWREEEKYKPLDELIWNIYNDTGYMSYVSLLPNGELKSANLKMLFEKAKEYESVSFKGLYNFITFMNNVKSGNSDKSAAKIIGENENVVRIMSIHKSKGLEFPVVILAGTGKKFNMQDLNDKLLLHKELGIGPQYIDSTRHIEFKTLAKSAISLKAKQEIISEEMRVLYVALTRAKEKLIITGMEKDYNKSSLEKEKMLLAYSDSKKINSFLVQKYKSYLDWIELVCEREKVRIKDLVDINVIAKNNLLKKVNAEEKEDSIQNKINKMAENLKNEEKEENLKKIIDWKYDFIDLKNIPTKSSVSKIKAEKTTLDNALITDKPKFLNNETLYKLSGAEKGTLMHLCIQRMNEKKDYTIDSIKNMINDLLEKQLITEIEAENINIEQLVAYTKSELWQDLKESKEIHKEQPFYINLPACKVYDTLENENVLVQGVIDLYYINKNDELVLIDYKTDYIENGKEHELAEKYELQLKIYKDALESALNKKVSKMGIYSVRTGKMAQCSSKI